jgi:transcriptional regulator of heat shock response
MSERERAILTAIIEEHVQTAAPVASGALAEKYELRLSPATIRSVMNALEDQGLLYSPHTSAGRVPTEAAYRWYVAQSLQAQGLPTPREQELLERRFPPEPLSLRPLAQMLSELIRLATVTRSANEVQIHGLSHIFRQPEFQRPESAAEIAEVVDRLDELLREIPERAGIQAYVGHETPLGKSAGYSIILRRYRTSWGEPVTFGVLGPTRMHYPRVIGLLNYTAHLMEEDDDARREEA